MVAMIARFWEVLNAELRAFPPAAVPGHGQFFPAFIGRVSIS
jgi:hypothetical protein